jgi:hypothetical protein
MQPMLELQIELDTVKQAKRNGYTSYKLTFLGVRGAPDRVFGKAGHTTVIEFKRPGERPSEQQEVRAAELREQFGWEVGWTDSYSEACDMLGIPE